MSKIFFIRHGQASFGSDDYDRLSDLGREQAGLLGAYWDDRKIGFDAVYSGSLQRQVQTAEIVTATVNKSTPMPAIEVLAEFDEYDSTGLFMTVVEDMVEENPALSDDLPRILSDPKDFQRLFEEMVNRWVSGRHRRPMAETWEKFTRRVRSGVERVMETCGSGKRVAVFSSAGALSAVMQKALGLSDRQTVAVSWSVYNSSVSVFHYSAAKRFSLSSFNSVAHLEIRPVPGLLTYR